MGSSVDNGRVTAGLPAVDPSVRFERNVMEGVSEKRSAILSSAAKKEAEPFAADGLRDVAEQAGLYLSGYEIMRRLSALNPSLLFIPSGSISSVMMICVRNNDLESGLQFVCGMEKEMSPEFEIPEYYEEERANGLGGYETVKVCTGTKRGWRTVLKKLMSNGLITEAGAYRMFGTPTIPSKRWQMAIS